MSYRDLKVWKLSREVVREIHLMTLSLPKFENFEVGQQIRRSSKSVKSNIVEGYGRRQYKNEYVRFLIFSHASNDETIDHLETLYETGSLDDKILFDSLLLKLNKLGKMLNAFIAAIENGPLTRK